MVQIQYIAIIIAATIVFIVSTVYYILLNKPYKKLLGVKPEKNDTYKLSITPNRIIIELARNFVLGLVIAYALAFLGIAELNQAIVLAAWLWVGFPLVFVVGLVAHENYSKGLAVIHAGDWLLKVLIFTIFLTVWK